MPDEFTTSNDEESASAKEALQFSTWRAALCLLDMRYSGTRKGKTSYENKVYVKKIPRPHEIVSLLCILSNSSMEIKIHLEDLTN